MGVHTSQDFQLAETANELLMDVARRIQIPRSKHDLAIEHYTALCNYVDRPGSPLDGKVVTCYPSGSFAIGAAVASKVRSDQHDIDVVMELDIPLATPPERVLSMLFEAINSTPGSKYYGKVRQNSRCVTVHYEDGVTVDLMPVVRKIGPDRVSDLYHHKGVESYRKEVNPYAFKEKFNNEIAVDYSFARTFSRSMFVEKADTEPMPDAVPLQEKSPRVVALQLMKRFRDVSYRTRSDLRKPPSVVLAALVLNAGQTSPTLLDELLALALWVKADIQRAENAGEKLDVRNPAHQGDVFTDRWPEDRSKQRLFMNDLDQLISKLELLRTQVLGPQEMRELLENLFGEAAAEFAVESYVEKRRKEADTGRLKFGTGGRVVTGSAAASSTAFAPRPSTNFGGDRD